MNRTEAAMLLAGVTSSESKQASAPTNVHLISGEVSGVSEDGIAKVAIDGLVFSEADDQYIEMDTLGGLEDGDVVTIILSGEPGGGMTPLAIGGSGTIDRISLRVTNIEADYVKTDELEANYAHISEGVIDNATIGHADVDGLSAAYAQIDGANITTATIRESWINKVMVQSGLIAQEGTVYTLDALQVNAENITAGTIDVERLIVTVNGEKYMVHIDPTTSSPTYEKLDGNIIEDLTITADKIVAGTITADKITTNNLVGTGGWINLRNGTFAYVNSTTGEGISWDGSHLSIGGASQLGNSTVNDIIDDIAEVADAVDNISVGGRNLLPTSLVNSNVRSGVTVSGITIVLEDDGWFRVSGSKSGNSAIGLWSDSDYTTPAVPQLDNISGKTLTWTIETEGTPFVTGSTYDTSTHIVAYGLASNQSDRFGGYADLVKTGSHTWTYYSEIRYYIGANVPSGTTVDGRFRVMAEMGNMSTAWTPAPEDIEAYADESAYLNAKPNLTPFFEHDLKDVYNATTNPTGYWNGGGGNYVSGSSTFATVMENGWVHINRTNSGTSTMNTYIRPFANGRTLDDGDYTFLVEFRNVESMPTTSYMYTQQGTDVQIWGDGTYGGFTINNADVAAGNQSYQAYYKPVQLLGVSQHGTTGRKLAHINWLIPVGGTVTCDLRLSIYEGNYTGPWKSYVDTELTARMKTAEAGILDAAKTATNYITADSTGIKIRMSSNSTTYQHQSSTATTYYVSGNKRAEVSANGLEVFDGTYGSEESVAAFGTVARLGKATGNKVIADSTGVHIYDVQGSQVAAFGQALGESTTTMLSDEPEIGTNYSVPSDAIEDISIMLDDQTLDKDTDYTLSSGIVTLLGSTKVTSILDDSGSSGEEGSEDVEAHSLTCEYRASAGVGLAIGASVTRPGLDVAERAIFRHPSFVEASHGTANADTGFRASRTDTGIQVFCGIGIGGVNHGVYSHVLNRWLINADRSAVHVAPHTVTDGNINVKSKYVYATTPSASKGNGWGHGLQYLDTAGGLVGVVKAYSLTTGEKGIQLQATRNIGSTTYNNGIRFGVDASGNLKLAFSGGGRLLWRQALGFDSGYVSASYGGSDNAPKNAYRDIPITFNFTHTYAPHVVVSFATGSTGVTMGGLSLSAFNVTTTGCTIRIYNNTNDARNPPLYWVAID